MADRTTEHEERIRRRAYEIWEREGRPESRDQDHWLKAEAELAAAGPQGNEGEGSRTAALAYDHSQTEFAEQADVTGLAEAAAAALDGPEGAELREAEAAGLAHSKGEDPELNRKKPAKAPAAKSPVAKSPAAKSPAAKAAKAPEAAAKAAKPAKATKATKAP